MRFPSRIPAYLHRSICSSTPSIQTFQGHTVRDIDTETSAVNEERKDAKKLQISYSSIQFILLDPYCYGHIVQVSHVLKLNGWCHALLVSLVFSCLSSFGHTGLLVLLADTSDMTH